MTEPKLTYNWKKMQIETSPGNWKRYICKWFGHDNIGTWNLLWGTQEILCLRCRESSYTRPTPEWKQELPRRSPCVSCPTPISCSDGYVPTCVEEVTDGRTAPSSEGAT